MIVKIKLLTSIMLHWRNSLHSSDSIEFYNAFFKKIDNCKTDELELSSSEINKLVLEFKQLDLMKKSPIIQFTLLQELEPSVQKTIPLEESKEIWMRAWSASVSLDLTPDQVSTLADQCLSSYTKRFGKCI